MRGITSLLGLESKAGRAAVPWPSDSAAASAFSPRHPTANCRPAASTEAGSESACSSDMRTAAASVAVTSAA